MGRLWRVVGVVVMLVVAAPAVAAVERDGGQVLRVYGTAISDTEFNLASVNVGISRPATIVVSASATGGQKIDGNWSIHCVNDDFDSSSRSDDFEARGRFRRTLKIPMRNPSSCDVSLYGSLSGSGEVRVTVQAARR